MGRTNMIQYKCGTCGEIQPADQFQRRRAGSDARRTTCNSCKNKAYHMRVLRLTEDEKQARVFRWRLSRERRKKAGYVNPPVSEQVRQQKRQEAAKGYAELKAQVRLHYGGQCACCGEREPLFLEMDHINNDGSHHRRIIGQSASQLYRWLEKNNWPQKEFQLLCCNCNRGRSRNHGICPHKIKAIANEGDSVQ